MIVEDEPLIRTGLKHYFAWQDLEVHTIVEADNGKEGLATALREQPDLVITDIRMPEMDGLQMIEEIRKVLPDTLFIILTGFNDFEYAQKAIRLGGVHDFLLKPLEYEESLATIQACMNRLKITRTELQTRSKLEQDIQENWKLKGSQLVKLLLEEEDTSIDRKMIRELCGFNSDDFLCQPFVLACLPHLDAHPQSMKWFKQHTERIIHETAESIFPSHIPRHIFTYISRSKLYGLVILEETQHHDNHFFYIGNLVQQQLDHTLKSLGSEYHTSFFVVVGPLTSDITQIYKLLHSADKALYQRFYRSDRNLFLASPFEEPSISAKATIIQLEENDKKRMITCIENGNATETHQLMQRLAQDVVNKAPHVSPEIWLAFLQEIISVIIRFSHRNSIHIEGVYSDKLLNLTFVDDFATLESLFEWLGRWMIHLGVVYTEGLTHNQQQDVIIFEHIESFIREHIDQDVTLQMVADRFFYNPSYLSRLFKRKLDKNYMRFVTEIRIEYAQECLKNPKYLITDVCAMCGYKSYKHFVKTFRSITSMTPSDYRKQSGW